MPNVADLEARVSVEGVPAATGQLGAFGGAVDRAGLAVGGAAAKAADHDARVRMLGRGAMVTGGLMMAGFGLAVGATMNFDKAMSGVEAVSGATSGQLEKLKQAALDAGAATAFSASDAARAEGELAKAGVSVSDILGGALMGSMNLAAAGQIDLGESAIIAAQAMNVFGLGGGDVAHVADVLAAAANKSAADVSGLGQGLQQVGLVANQTGLSFEETVAMLALFADNALVGSDAGTSMKSMLQRLTPQSQEAADTMAMLGISAYDASGQFIGAAEFAANLHDALEDLTPEQRNAAMATMFGSDAVRAANIVYEAGAEGVREHEKALRDDGFAGEQAATQMDNLGGDLERLKGSIETALIQGGSGATDALRSMAQGAEGAVNAFGDLPAGAQSAAVAISGIGGAALFTLGAIGSMAPKVREGLTAVQSFGSFVGGGTFGGNVAKGGLAVGGFLLASQLVGPELTELTGSAEIAYGSLGAVAGLSFGPWGAAAGGVLGAIYGHFFGVEDAAGAAEAAIKQFTSSLKAGDEGPFVLTLDEIKNTLDGLAEGTGPKAANIMNDLGFSMEGLTSAVNSGWVGLDAFRSQVLTAAEAADLGDGKIKILNDTFDSFGLSLHTAREEQLAYASSGERAMILTGAFSDSLGQLNLAIASGAGNTAVGTESYNAMSQALSDTGESLTNVFAQQVAFTGSTMGAAAATQGQTQSLVDTMNQLSGGNIPMTSQYIGTLFGIPAGRFTNVQNTADIARVVTEFLIGTYNALPPSKNTTVNADTAPAHGALRSLLDVINSSTATVKVKAQAVDLAAIGAFPGGQHGGVHSGITWVGEAGPELALLPHGTRILTHEDSMQAAREAMALERLERLSAPAALAISPGGGGDAPRHEPTPTAVESPFKKRRHGDIVNNIYLASKGQAHDAQKIADEIAWRSRTARMAG